MKILVPIDFSPDALQALQYAATLARMLKTTTGTSETSPPELLLYHAFHVPIGGEATFFVDSAMLDKAERSERTKLQQTIGSIPELQRIPHRVVTRMSLPGEGILETIGDEPIDLVVMGLRGSGESSDWLGSTTLQVMKNVTCPVLAVPRNTRVFHPKQVAFATDLEALGDTSSLHFLKVLLQLWQANVHIIHVHPHPATIGIKQAEEALQLDHLFGDIPHTYHFPEDTDAGRGIAHYLQEHPADLLVIIPRYHFALESIFHKSVTRYLTSHTSVPLLAFHEKL